MDYDAKYNMDQAFDSGARDGAFTELFKEVNEINAAMAQFRTFFNAEGYFQKAEFLKQTELTLSRETYDDLLKVFKALSKAATTILKAYNTDLLDMFRITSKCTAHHTPTRPIEQQALLLICLALKSFKSYI